MAPATSAAGATRTADLMLLLSHVSRALETELVAGLADLGITPRHHCVLSKARTGDLTQGQLAELCDLDKTTMVVTIDDLEAAGLATRLPSSTDRRARIIAVTTKGERMVTKAQAIVDRIFADVLATLPSRERDGLLDGLTHLVGGRLAEPPRCDHPPRRSRNR